jgi:hypothetical protein
MSFISKMSEKYKNPLFRDPPLVAPKKGTIMK